MGLMDEKQKILIIDDDPQIRKILERMLSAPRFSVLSLEGGDRVLEAIENFSPYLVILDVMMPRISGIEICRKIRQHFPERPLQILMLSAKDNQSDRRQALEYGADDYVTKPFHLGSLARKIDYIFEKKLMPPF